MSALQALRRTVAAANAGNATLAKMHLQKAAEESPDDAGVWLWMAWFADSPLNAIHCLEMAQADRRYQRIAELGLQWARALATFKEVDTDTIVTASDKIEAVDTLASTDVESALVAEVAEVASEVASAVKPVAIAETVLAGVSAADSSAELAVPAADPWGETAEVDVWESGVIRSESSLIDQSPPPLSKPEVIEELTQHRSAPVTVSVENSEVANAASKSSGSGSDWFTPSRAFASGSTRASLWGGLGFVGPNNTETSDADRSTETPEVVNSATPFETNSWETDSAANSFASSVVTESLVASEASKAEIQDSFAKPPKVAEPEPVSADNHESTSAGSSVWRAAKTDWFGDTTAAEVQPTVAVTTSRLADSLFETSSTEVVVESPAVAAPIRPAPTIVVAQPSQEHFAESQLDSDSESGHGEDVEAQLCDEPASHFPPVSNVIEAIEVVEVTEAVVESKSSGDKKNDVKNSNGQSPVTSLATKPGKTVLVVDDSPTVRKLVAMTLEKRGFQVVAAFDGVAAIKEIATHNPDLILMDVTMPRLDGYQLCKLVKKHEATKHIPVIMLSGKDGMFDRLRGRLVGCSGYISKPFVPETLVETVEEHLAQAASR